jgi:hypothetical protein
MAPDRNGGDRRASRSNPLIEFVNPDLGLNVVPRTFRDVDGSRIIAYVMPVPEASTSIVARKAGPTWRVQVLEGDYDTLTAPQKERFDRTIRQMGAPAWKKRLSDGSIGREIEFMVLDEQRDHPQLGPRNYTRRA